VFESFKDSGKVRSIGVSNFESQHIDALWDKVRHKPTVNQCEFHPHLTRRALVDYCRNKGLFFQAHTSLAKHSKLLYTDPTIVEIARKHNASIPQVLLAFAYQQNVGILPKSGNQQRIAENMHSLNLCLTEEEIEQLNRLERNKRYSDCDGWNVL